MKSQGSPRKLLIALALTFSLLSTLTTFNLTATVALTAQDEIEGSAKKKET
ncbi:MAG: hypothetical protein RLZZ131_212, partial [Actinomycetota bacterium]